MNEAKKMREDWEKVYEANRIHEVRLSWVQDVEKSIKFKKNLEGWINSGSQEIFTVKDKSSHFRRYIYNFLQLNYPELGYKTIQNDEYSEEKEIQVYKMNDTELQDRKAKMFEEVSWIIGFTSVIELLSESRKKLVGHNCYIDLLFLYSHFVEYIPSNYFEYKTKLHQLFPE